MVDSGTPRLNKKKNDVFQSWHKKEHIDKKRIVLKTLSLALSITFVWFLFPSPRGLSDTLFRNWINMDRYSTSINMKGIKKYRPQTEANPNQNLLGQIKLKIQNPSSVIHVVGIILARLNSGPKSHAAIIIMITCFFLKDVLWNTEMRSQVLVRILKVRVHKYHYNNR